MKYTSDGLTGLVMVLLSLLILFGFFHLFDRVLDHHLWIISLFAAVSISLSMLVLAHRKDIRKRIAGRVKRLFK